MWSPALSALGGNKGHPWAAAGNTGGIQAKAVSAKGPTGRPTTAAWADLQHKEVLFTGVIISFYLLGIQQHLPVGEETPVSLWRSYEDPSDGLGHRPGICTGHHLSGRRLIQSDTRTLAPVQRQGEQQR